MSGPIPEGYEEIDVEVYRKGDRLIILGDPDEPDDGQESNHNCDHMGCRWSHVIAVAKVDYIVPATPPGTEVVPEGTKAALDVLVRVYSDWLDSCNPNFDAVHDAVESLFNVTRYRATQDHIADVNKMVTPTTEAQR